MFAPVLELQQLQRELDVGEPARSELQMTAGIGAARDPLAFHARLEVSHLRQSLRRKPVWVGDEPRQFQEPFSELDVSGRYASFGQGLVFPRLGPSLRSEERRVGKECRSRRSP